MSTYRANIDLVLPDGTFVANGKEFEYDGNVEEFHLGGLIEVIAEKKVLKAAEKKKTDKKEKSVAGKK